MKHSVLRIAYGALAAACLSLGACGGSDDGGTPDGGTTGGADAGGTVQEPTYTGTYNHYVTNLVKVGANAGEAGNYGFAFDDLTPTMDNRIGTILGTFAGQLGLDAEIKGALDMGTFIILHSVRADTLASDTSVQWSVFLGDAKANPDFTSGNGMFTVKTGTTASKVGGATATSKFTTNPSFVTTLKLELSLSTMGQPLAVTLVAPRIEATSRATAGPAPARSAAPSRCPTSTTT